VYVGRDFDPGDTGEEERFSFDFVNDLEASDTITSVVWTCAVAAKSEMPDAAAATRISGAPFVSGKKTTQRVIGLLAGVTYVLTAVATTGAGDVVSLWSHVECKVPA
jgi:hypothetical protein